MAGQAGAEQSDVARRLERYYRFHHLIYDATRWSFLFGRGEILSDIPSDFAPRRILEVGCGTGANLKRLRRRYPNAELTGIDLSGAMLDTARKALGNDPHVRLVHAAYSTPLSAGEPFDLVLFSYSLSMMNPGWEDVLRTAQADLRDGGLIAAVDFHDSRWAGFRRWMGANHVRMEGHLLPVLETAFTPVARRVLPAYGGVWLHMRFVGRKDGGTL